MNIKNTFKEGIDMGFLDAFKDTACTLVDTVSAAAHNYVERNRTKAKLNRLRMVMKNESELMNRAYIALGKEYYEIKKTGREESTERTQSLFKVVDNSKAKLARARDCYRDIIESENELLYNATVETKNYEARDVQDITVACSNESDYKSSPFPAAEEAPAQEAETADAPAQEPKAAEAEPKAVETVAEEAPAK